MLPSTLFGRLVLWVALKPRASAMASTIGADKTMAIRALKDRLDPAHFKLICTAHLLGREVLKEIRFLVNFQVDSVASAALISVVSKINRYGFQYALRQG